MKEVTINGRTVKTNYYEVDKWAVWNGNDYPKTMRVVNVPFGKSVREVFEELVTEGYTRIRFVEMTTCVRGYRKVYAFVK